MARHDVNVNLFCQLGGGSSALQHALERDSPPDILRMIATHESLDVDSAIYHGSPVLVWAGSRQNPDLLEHLLGRSDIDVNAANTEGRTALHECLLYGSPASVDRPRRRVLEVLLAHKGVRVDIRDNCGKTPSDIAEEGHRTAEVYERLLSRALGPENTATEIE